MDIQYTKRSLAQVVVDLHDVARGLDQWSSDPSLGRQLREHAAAVAALHHELNQQSL